MIYVTLPPVYSNMNKRERSKLFPFVLERDGSICGRCKKTVDKLRYEWELHNPNQVRKSPYLVLHHIDGDERFPHSRDGTYCGNLMLLCCSCNQLLRRRKIAPDSVREKTPEMQRRDTATPLFFDWLDNYLANYSQICEERMINRGSKIAGVLQPSVMRYYKQQIHYEYVKFEIAGHEVPPCNYPECKGIHVCLANEVPRKIDMIGRIVHEEEKQVVE